MKKYLLTLLCLVAVSTSFAQESKQEKKVAKPTVIKPMNVQLSALVGKAKFANHYIMNQECTGPVIGFELEAGRLYRRSENVSWEAKFSRIKAKNGHLFTPLLNPAQTNGITAKTIEANYATHYNWSVGKGWVFKLGGMLDFYGDANNQIRRTMNNAISIQGSIQVFASTGVCYKAEFEKWALRVFYNMSTPFLGLALSDSPYENGYSAMIQDNNVLASHERHVRGTTPHNYQGFNCETGLNFETPYLTVTLAYESANRWWYTSGVQNYRKMSFCKIGLGVNLFQKRDKSASRYF